MTPIGLPIDRGFELGKAQGRFPLRIRLTAPPGSLFGIGQLRIIAERPFGDGVEWVLAYENYEKLPREGFWRIGARTLWAEQ